MFILNINSYISIEIVKICTSAEMYGMQCMRKTANCIKYGEKQDWNELSETKWKLWI